MVGGRCAGSDKRRQGRSGVESCDATDAKVRLRRDLGEKTVTIGAKLLSDSGDKVTVKYCINGRSLSQRPIKDRRDYIITLTLMKSYGWMRRWSEERFRMEWVVVAAADWWSRCGWRVFWRRNKDTQGLRKIEKDSRGAEGQNITNLGGIAPALIIRPAASAE